MVTKLKIKKLQINGFGNVENKEITLSDGINIIYGKNESGKTTIGSFIKCVFYGINKNKSGNEFSEYELRKPWNSSDFSGKIEYEFEGKKYTVFRDFNRNNCKVYDEDGADITASFNKDKTRGAEVGISHLGIDEETFFNTLFVEQNCSLVELQSQKSIVQKLTNIMQSGQEAISFEKIKEKLQKKSLDEIGTDRTRNKPLNIVKREIQEKEQLRNRLLNNRYRNESLTEKQKEIEKQIETTNHNSEQVKTVLEIREKYSNLLEEKERTYELTKKIKEKERQEKLENSKKQFRNAIILLSVITVLACIFLICFHKSIWIILEILFAIIGGIALKMTNKTIIVEEDDKDFDVTKEELNKKELKELDKLRQKGIKTTYIERKAFELKNLLDGLQKKQNDLILEQHKIKIEQEGLKENIEKLAETEEQLINLKNKKEELDRKAKIIGITLEKLEEAYEELKSEVIPELQRNIKSKIEKTTNGKYNNVIYNNNEGLIVENSVGDYVSVNKLSLGTIDQMYLGFRLGISEKIGDIPIVLDECFAYYDNERLKNILKSLKNINKQIIILTCSNREKDFLDKLGIKCEYIEL